MEKLFKKLKNFKENFNNLNENDLKIHKKNYIFNHNNYFNLFIIIFNLNNFYFIIY